jgi:AraC-like DNA-binding protein
MSRSDFDFESRLVPLLLAYAKQKGVAVEPLAEKYKLPPEALKPQVGKPTIITPVSVLPALAEEVAAALNDPHVGLSLSAWVPKGSYGVAEFAINASPTLREAYQNLVRFTAILAPQQSFKFEEDGNEGRLHHGIPQRPGAIGSHLAEFTTGVMVKGVVALHGTKPKRAWFSHPRPAKADVARLTELLHTEAITFDEPTNGFAIDAKHLDGPVIGGDPALFAFLEEHALAALASRPKSDDLIDKLRHFIRDALKQGEPNVERLAVRLNMSGRTLQRRLSDLKTSFQEVLDLVRFDLSRQYLKDARLDVSQIAYLLGYSELRAFDRAFRRWANKSPSEWRSETT